MRPLCAASVAVIAAAVAAPAWAYDYSPAAARVLEQARTATGGKGWDTLRGWRETGLWGGVRYQFQVDPVRFGYRMETEEADGRRLRGYNGVGDWEIAPGGSTTGMADKATLAQARTIAFFSAHGFLFPGRFAAHGSLVGVQQHQGRSFDVLRIEPAGGLPRELWFDRSTRMLVRVVDRNGPVPVTMELSDYRKVGPVMLPFRVAVDDGRQSLRQVEAINLIPVDRAQFSLAR